jgi:hypothetical protein
MPREFDLHSELAAGILDRRGAWEFVRGFAAAWSAPIRDGDGYDGSELAATEERLGFRLPAALREAYALFGLRKDLNGTMHRLLPLEDLGVWEPGDLLSYHAENQGVWGCGVRLADLQELPPGVERANAWWHRPGSVADINIRARTPAALENARKRLPRAWFDWR